MLFRSTYDILAGIGVIVMVIVGVLVAVGLGVKVGVIVGGSIIGGGSRKGVEVSVGGSGSSVFGALVLVDGTIGGREPGSQVLKR